MFMARQTDYLQLKPDTASELLEMLEAVYNQEQPSIRVEHFASIYTDIKQMVDNTHYCTDCNTHYFDAREGEYNMKCDECCEKMKEENE
jgi:hypothetical protein